MRPLPVTDDGALVSMALGFAALLYGLFVPGLGTTRVLLWMGVGVLLVFFGVARVSTRLIPRLTVLVSPLARWSCLLLSVIFWPFFTLPYWLLRWGAWGPGGAGIRVLAFLGGALLNPLILLIVLVMWLRKAMSRWEPEWPMEFPGVVPDRSTTRVGAENARRNPQRTASTAAALMIGLALVTLVATLAAGIISSFTDAVNDLFTGDYAITAQNNFSPIPIDAARRRRRRRESSPSATSEPAKHSSTGARVRDGRGSRHGPGDQHGLEEGLAGRVRTLGGTACSSTTRSPTTTTSTSDHPSS